MIVVRTIRHEVPSRQPGGLSGEENIAQTEPQEQCPAQAEGEGAARPGEENVIAQLKSGVGALRVPVYDLVSNWAYMVMAALAWNLKSWLAMMMHLKADRRKYVAMEFRRFVREMILLPCQVIRRARQTTLRIIGWQPATDRLFSAWRTIERTGFG